MTLQMDAIPVPMSMDASGGIRISGTRITLDNLMAHFDAGESPEQIVQQLDTLNLADVYLVRGYCLLHLEDVRDYLKTRSEQAKHTKAVIETETDSAGFVQEVLSRGQGR